MVWNKFPGLGWHRYTTVLGSEPSDEPSPTAARGFANAVTSKRFRWIAISIALCGLLFLLFRSYASFHGIEPPPPPEVAPVAPVGEVDWSRFAYTQYVTNSEYLCNSVMFFESLQRLSSRADRVVMYPSDMLETGNEDTHDARLLIKARDEYNVKLVPISVQHKASSDPTWADSFTKLLAFNQTQYDRVLSIDSDILLLQNLDELFLLPPVPVAMPRAYWLWPDDQKLSSQVNLIQPSEVEFSRVMDKIAEAEGKDYDMEIMNYLYRDSALVLPHRPYDLLTGEFTAKDHKYYLGSDTEEWDPLAVYNEAKLVHFSDWPVPKPWLATPESLQQAKQPDCVSTPDGEDCTARELWNGFYSDFRDLRKRVCDTVRKKRSRTR